LTGTACKSFYWDITKAVATATLKIAALVVTGGSSAAA